jgi:hypothetical protein
MIVSGRFRSGASMAADRPEASLDSMPFASPKHAREKTNTSSGEGPEFSGWPGLFPAATIR